MVTYKTNQLPKRTREIQSDIAEMQGAPKENFQHTNIRINRQTSDRPDQGGGQSNIVYLYPALNQAGVAANERGTRIIMKIEFNLPTKSESITEIQAAYTNYSKAKN